MAFFYLLSHFVFAMLSNLSKVSLCALSKRDRKRKTEKNGNAGKEECLKKSTHVGKIVICIFCLFFFFFGFHWLFLRFVILSAAGV